MTSVVRAAPVPEGGVGTGEADLWCTYAAIRTLRWLGRIDLAAARSRTAAYLSGRRNADGGYAWSRGMASDAWATYYCTQALHDLGERAPGAERTAEWLHRTWSGDAFAMVPGQGPDAWATFFSTTTLIEVCRDSMPDPSRLLAWLRALQTADGGLSWSPDHALTGAADVRASFYGVLAWLALSRVAGATPPWDVDRLVGWVRHQQTARGGFRLSPEAEIPCLWATYRAVTALAALGARPHDPQRCVRWIDGLRGESGAFVRWEGYEVEDVWASFSAVGALRALGVPTRSVEGPVTARLAALACPGGGYTYREPDRAADALATAAAVLADGPVDRRAAVYWLEGCLLPNEEGVMYMPARGAEVRCTLWAVAAGAFDERPGVRARIARWLRGLQNPDGGFGYWEGRASDMVSTCAAVETLRLLDVDPVAEIDGPALVGFLGSCRDVRSTPDAPAWSNVPRAPATLRSTLQGLRAGTPAPGAVAAALGRHHVAGGGYANEGNRLPDLLTTYEAVLAADRASVPIDAEHVRRFLGRLRRPAGTAWTPLAPDGGGPLADCLGMLLDRRLAGRLDVLPPLALS